VAPPRPCGAIGAAWSEPFLTACGAAHDEHMGCENVVRGRIRVSLTLTLSLTRCENMAPLLYALCRCPPRGVRLRLRLRVRVRIRVRVRVSPNQAAEARKRSHARLRPSLLVTWALHA
jgi:hypothetical protein